MRSNKFNKSLIILMMAIFSLVSCSSEKPANGFNKRLRGQINIIVEKEREEYIRTFAKEFSNIFHSVSFNIKVQDELYDNFGDILNEKGKSKSNIIIADSKYSSYIVKDYADELWDISYTLQPYKDNYYKEELKKFTLNNAIYGLPLDKKPYFMIYRKDIFEKSKINPEDIRTWNEFISKCSILKKDLNKEVKFLWEDKENTIYDVMLSQLAASNNYFGENSNLSSQDAKKVVDTIDTFKKNNMVSSGDLIEKIKKEEIISSIVSISVLYDIMNKLPEMKGKWVVAKVPAFEIGGNREVSLDGYSLFIPKEIHNKDAVLTFLEFIIANEKLHQKLLIEKGIFTPSNNAPKWSDINKGLEYYNDIKLWLMAAYAEKLLIGK